MLVIEPQQWPGQLVPWWQVKEDGDNWSDSPEQAGWDEQHEPEAN